MQMVILVGSGLPLYVPRTNSGSRPLCTMSLADRDIFWKGLLKVDALLNMSKSMTFLIKIKKYLFLGIMLSNINIASGVTIVTPGKVNCYIELGKAATATEKYAAEELINTIHKMTGMQIASSKKTNTNHNRFSQNQ